MALTALIVEDERLAAAHLRQLLTSLDIDVVGEAGSAQDGIRMVEDLKPEVLFLDIQMPGLSGMQMADIVLGIDNPPMIVFVTGYSEYAVDAFEKDALDYLVKPVSKARLEQTLARARERSGDAGARQRAVDAVSQAAQTDAAALKRLPIRDDYAVRLIKIDEILYAEAREKRVYVNVTGGEFRTYYTLKQLEGILPSTFFRAHESCIVNLEYVQELHFLGNHAYEMGLSDGRHLPVSRTKFAELQRRLGL